MQLTDFKPSTMSNNMKLTRAQRCMMVRISKADPWLIIPCVTAHASYNRGLVEFVRMAIAPKSGIAVRLTADGWNWLNA